MKILKVLFSSFFLFILFFTLSNFDNYVNFSGDSWEYQSIAVNFALHNKVMHQGGVSPFKNYQFYIDKEDPATYNIQSFYENARINFHRNPSYPIFIGLIYKIIGIKPYWIKIIQLILLSISASLLLLTSQLIFKKGAWFIGISSAFFFMANFYKIAGEFFPEPLLCFIFSLLLWAMSSYFKKRTWFIALLFSIVIALSLLSKGIFYFIFMLFVMVELYNFIETKSINILKKLIGISFVSLLLITPYVYWQNEVDEYEPIFIVLQGLDVILDSNNEYCKDGLWHPDWKNNYNAFYQKDENQSLLGVLRFYNKNPEILFFKIPNTLYNSFFYPFISFQCIQACIALFFLYIFKNKFWSFLGVFISYFFLIYFVLNDKKIYQQIDSLNYVKWAYVLIAFIAFLYLINKKIINKKEHSSLIIGLIAAVIIVILFYGYWRIILPFYFSFALLGIYLHIEVLKKSITALSQIQLNKYFVQTCIFLFSLEILLRLTGVVETFSEKNNFEDTNKLNSHSGWLHKHSAKTQALVSYAKEDSIPMIYISESQIKYYETEPLRKYTWEENSYFNSLGYQVMAEQIFDIIIHKHPKIIACE